MFDFQKLAVYQKAKSFNKEIFHLSRNNAFDKVTNDQLRRASFSIMLNISEGVSRFSNKERRHYMVISIGSVFECVAILEYLCDVECIEEDTYKVYYSRLEELSKMLFGLIKKFGE